MGKLNHGPSSRAKGKAGGWVYQQYEGMQVFREYQPNVKNPQTEKQVENRADFKLASQTVALYKEVINARLGKLSIYTRTRRGAAVEALKRIAKDSGDGAREIIFSQAVSAINQKSLTEYAAPTVVLNQTDFEVTAPADAEILGVIAGFDSHGEFVGRKIVSGTSAGSALQFAIPADYEVAKAMFVYTLPQTEEGRAIYENITDPNDILMLDITRLVSSGDVAISDIAAGTYSA